MKVLVITMNSLHLGYLGCYGNQWIETPALDGLASESVVFDQHIADCPDAEGAWSAWRTGCYDFQSRDAPPADLLQLLKRQGTETHLLLDREPGANANHRAGWSELHWSETPEEVFNGAYGVLDELAARDNWLAWLELSSLMPPWRLAGDTARLYFTADTADEEDEETETRAEAAPLTPLLAPEGLIELEDDATFARLQRTYAAAVTELDAGLGGLLEELDSSDAFDDVLIVLTSDRGLPLGEHGIVGHDRPWLHEELVHVPLMVRVPKKTIQGRRILTPTQPIDLMPTLLEAFGLTPPAVDGRSLWPLIRGQTKAVRSQTVSLLRVGNSGEAALRTGQWCFILPLSTATDTLARAPQLYVKPDDRWEVNNVLQHHTDLADELEKSLRELVAPARAAESAASANATPTSPVLEGASP
jgi:arylsulfatase A-like enzyme